MAVLPSPNARVAENYSYLVQYRVMIRTPHLRRRSMLSAMNSRLEENAYNYYQMEFLVYSTSALRFLWNWPLWGRWCQAVNLAEFAAAKFAPNTFNSRKYKSVSAPLFKGAFMRWRDFYYVCQDHTCQTRRGFYQGSPLEAIEAISTDNAI